MKLTLISQIGFFSAAIVFGGCAPRQDVVIFDQGSRAIADNNSDIELKRFSRNNPNMTTLRDPFDQGTLLHFAAKRNKRDATKYLLNSGADPNAVDCAGNTALHLHAKTGLVDISIVELLLRAGANPNLQNQSRASFFDMLDAKDTDTVAIRKIFERIRLKRTNENEPDSK